MFFPILLEITKGQEKEKKGLEWEIKGGKGQERRGEWWWNESD